MYKLYISGGRERALDFAIATAILFAIFFSFFSFHLYMHLYLCQGWEKQYMFLRG